MIRLSRSETLVLSHSAKEIRRLLELNTRPVAGHYANDRFSKHLFNGWVRKNKFCLSRRIKQPDNFIPLMQGKIDETSLGSIVFIRYRLFPSTFYFLIFWSVLTLMIALFFFVIHNLVIYGVISLGLGILNLAITIAKFRKETRKSRMLVNDFFNQPHKYTFTE